MRGLRNLLIGVLVLAAAFAGSIFFQESGKATDGKKAGPRYKEFVVTRGTFQMTVTSDGVVRPINRIEIKSKASGQIEALPVEEGDQVRKGDLIAKLDQKNEQTAVVLAEADLEIAQAERKQAEQMFSRRNQLFKKKIISEEERDQTGLTLALAKAKVIQTSTALEREKERLRESVVRAPFDGIILQKYVEEGQIIASGVSSASGGTPIVDLASMTSVYIEAWIDEIDIGKIRIGQNATVVADAFPQLKFKGKIVRIAPEARLEQNVTLFNVIVEVENKEGKLKSGMNTSIQARIMHKEDVLLVPATALLDKRKRGGPPHKKTVLLKEGGTFIPHQVIIGLADFKLVEIMSGVKEGDILGVPMTSRLKQENEQLEKRIKKGRQFGGGGVTQGPH